MSRLIPGPASRAALLIVLAAAGALAACGPSAPKGVDKAKLDDVVGTAIGSPGTCVQIVEKASGKSVWRYGEYISCARELPSCQGAATTTLGDVAVLAAKGDERALSCDSLPDGSRSVGWATGTAGTPGHGLAYAAVVESGDRPLPGREIKTRLEAALAKAGL